MGFLSLWPLALLVLVPIIILLYILKQETKPKEFSSSMLWKEVVRNMEATKPWEKLKKNILLFLQILTVLLFVVTMMHPWIKGFGTTGGQLILVIDNSASMATLYDDNRTRLDAAKESACAYVDDASTETSVYVISGNKQAVLEIANCNDKLEAKNKIKSIEQTYLAGDLSVSLGLVESCIQQAKNADVVFMTDSVFDAGNISASIDSFYNENINVAMESVSYATKAENTQILAQLTNYSNSNLKREINLYGTDKSGKESLLDIKSVDISAEETDSVYFEFKSKDVGRYTGFRAEINDKDSLVADNSSWCVENEQKEKKVLLYTDSNMFIEKAMDNIAGVTVYKTSDEAVFDEDTDYDMYIFDGKIPDNIPKKGSLLFINCKKSEFFKNKKSVENTKLILEDCDITTYVSGVRIGVNKSYVYHTPHWAKSYIRAAGKEKDSLSAGFYGIYDGRKIATIGFDIHQTDFGLQAEFPILISDMADYMLDGSLLEDVTYTSGDNVVLHGSTKGSAISIIQPDGSRKNISASQAAGTYIQVDNPGLYNVSQEVDKETLQEQFAVLFPTREESSVESVKSTILSNDNIKEADIKAGTHDLSRYLLVLLLILMILEWIVYVRLT